MATTNKAFRLKSGLILDGGAIYPAAGTAAVGGAPIYLSSGTNLTTAAAGAMEFDGTRFYLTPSTTRKAVALTDSTGVTLDSSITGSSLTSVGTLVNLTVTNTITGSVSGNAGTVTNGVYTTGSYTNPSWLVSIPFSKLTSTPTTLSGYGITDAATSTHVHGNITNTGTVTTSVTATNPVKVLITDSSNIVGTLTTTGASGTTFLRGDGTWASPATTVTYTTSAVTTTGGAFLRLTGSDASTDDLKFAGSGATSVAYTDASTITISSTDNNYYPTAVTMTAGTTAGPTVDLTMSGTSNITGAAIPSASATASGVVTTGAQTLAGAKTFSGNATFNGTVTLSADPVSAMQAATKQYVDGVAQGVNAHDAVQYATTTTIAGTYAAGSAGADGGTGVGATITYTSTGTTTIDGGSNLALNDRVLVKDGVTADAGTGSKANGIYYVTTAGTTGVATVLTRALDYDNSVAGDIMTGDLVYVVAGTSNGGIQFLMNVTGTATTPNKGIKIGTDAITWTQFSGATSTLAGAGLIATGNVFAVGAGTGISVTTDAVSLATSSFTANAASGTATSFVTGLTVDSYGRTTATASSTVPTASSSVLGLASFDTTNFTVTAGNVVLNQVQAAKLTGQVSGANGGTGVDNTGKTITLGGNLTTVNGAITLTGSASATNATLPASGSITLVDLATSQALTNKTISGLTITTSTGTLTIANGKTLTASNTLTFTGTDSSSVAFGSGGTVAYTANKLNAFAATSSSELAGIISDETGSGALVFGTSPTIASQTATGTYSATPNAAIKVDSTVGIISGSGSGSALFKLSNLFDKTAYNGAEFTVKMSNGTDFEIIRILVVIKGTTFYVTQYGDVQSNASIGTVDFELDATNTNNVNMTITPASGTVTAKMVGTLLAA